MMLARKWDRIENILSNKWDIFAAIRKDPSGKDGSMLAEIRDLRRYLMLVEAEAYAQGWIADGQDVKEDSNKHAFQAEEYVRSGVDVDGEEFTARDTLSLR